MCSLERMNTKVISDLYAWSKDLESSSDVLHREIPAFAMLLGCRVKGFAPRDWASEL